MRERRSPDRPYRLAIPETADHTSTVRLLPNRNPFRDVVKGDGDRDDDAEGEILYRAHERGNAFMLGVTLRRRALLRPKDGVGRPRRAGCQGPMGEQAARVNGRPSAFESQPTLGRASSAFLMAASGYS